MKQVIQTFKTGELQVIETPPPALRPGGILVRTRNSLVSAGTERMVVDFGEKSLLNKARARPELVRQVLNRAQREGILTTIDGVRSRLDQAVALGYSSAGIVIAAGREASGFKAGDRVACAGVGYAGHAEIAYIPRNLCATLAENVSFEAGSFVTLGAIALQGIRQSAVVLGDNVAVIGLGLLGQLATQMLKAAGCRVFGIDLDPRRVQLSLRTGIDLACTNETAIANGHAFTNNSGFDAVLITADTASNDPVQLAGELARDRAIVVAVGAVGMQIPRNLYYEKELDFRLSRSYGPGRYDSAYEERGQDYPYGYVRWTEQRNMQAFVQLVAEGRVNVEPLITHRFSIEHAGQAYDLITGKTKEPFLGVLLSYPDECDLGRRVTLRKSVPVGQTAPSEKKLERVNLGVVGAGGFANSTLLPVLKGIENIALVGIASGRGITAQSVARRFAFDYCSSDVQEILDDPNINTVAILTRHHLHASQTIAALEAGKHVFVEKPLCLTEEELASIVAARGAAVDRSALKGSVPPVLLVGFNRRFAPHIVELKEHIRDVREPFVMSYRVNAGYVPAQHWAQDIEQGGGRLLGEVCHFVDVLVNLAGTMPEKVMTQALPNGGRYSNDNLLITLAFPDGSLGTITYIANGEKSAGKERLEVFGGGLTAVIDDYRELTIYASGKKIKRTARLRQDKGHRAEWQALVSHLMKDGPLPISFEDIIGSTETSLAAQRSLESGAAEIVPR